MNHSAKILALYTVFSLTSMAGMNLAFGVVTIGFLAVLCRRENPAIRELISLADFRRYLIAGAWVFVTCLLSLIVAKLHPHSYAGHAPDITAHGFLKIWYMLSPGILAVTFAGIDAERRKNLKAILISWWIMVLPLCAVAVIQFYTGWPHPQGVPTYPGHYHATLFLGHHLSTASILIFPTFTALAVAFGRLRRKERLMTLEWAAGTAGVLILYLSYARTAWLAIPIGLVLIFGKYLKPKWFAASTAALVATVFAMSRTQAIQERMASSTGIRDRVRLWEANFDFFKNRPVTGIGWLKTQEMSEFYFKEKFPGNYLEYFWGHAHNNFLEMLGGTGILGTSAFLLWTGFTLMLAWNTRKQAEMRSDEFLSDVSWGIFVALILLHFNGLTNVTFWEGKVMHQQMLAVGLLFMIRLTLNPAALSHGESSANSTAVRAP
jgi:O-antigen ligase